MCAVILHIGQVPCSASYDILYDTKYVTKGWHKEEKSPWASELGIFVPCALPELLQHMCSSSARMPCREQRTVVNSVKSKTFLILLMLYSTSAEGL